jgi:thiol-disulfide isomerase/thioredoxin
MSANVKEIQANQFPSEVTQSKQPVALDFFSTECAPCEPLAPKYEAVADQFAGKVTFLKIFRQGNRYHRSVGGSEVPARKPLMGLS